MQIGKFIPDPKTAAMAMGGGAAYMLAFNASKKFLNLPDVANILIGALAVHILGTQFLKNRDVGVAAIGAAGAHFAADMELAKMVGLADTSAALPEGFATVQLPDGREQLVSVNDYLADYISDTGRHHRVGAYMADVGGYLAEQMQVV